MRKFPYLCGVIRRVKSTTRNGLANQKEVAHDTDEVQEKMVSHPLYDAWKITPPCQLKQGDCHIECPYYHECQGDDTDDDDDNTRWTDNSNTKAQIKKEGEL